MSKDQKDDVSSSNRRCSNFGSQIVLWHTMHVTNLFLGDLSQAGFCQGLKTASLRHAFVVQHLLRDIATSAVSLACATDFNREEIRLVAGKRWSANLAELLASVLAENCTSSLAQNHDPDTISTCTVDRLTHVNSPL